MGAGAFLEPLVVVVLLFGGAWINRATDFSFSSIRSEDDAPLLAGNSVETGEDLNLAEAQITKSKRSLSPSLLPSQETRWHERELRIMGYKKMVETPNTAVFRNRVLSRLLHKFPFLVEAWYWALIYWVRDCGRRNLCIKSLTGPGLSTRQGLHCCHHRRGHRPRSPPPRPPTD